MQQLSYSSNVPYVTDYLLFSAQSGSVSLKLCTLWLIFDCLSRKNYKRRNYQTMIYNVAHVNCYKHLLYTEKNLFGQWPSIWYLGLIIPNSGQRPFKAYRHTVLLESVTGNLYIGCLWLEIYKLDVHSYLYIINMSEHSEHCIRVDG